MEADASLNPQTDLYVSTWRVAYNVNVLVYAYRKPGSSVSIVSDYGLDDRAIEVRSPAEAKGFFL
jgi:hypothetical protein